MDDINGEDENCDVASEDSVMPKDVWHFSFLEAVYSPYPTQCFKLRITMLNITIEV